MISRFLSRLRKRALSIRLAVLIIGCSLFMALLASGIQLYFEYHRDVEAMHANFDFIEKSYLPAITTSSYLMDDKQLRIQLKGVLQIRGIEYLQVTEQREGELFRLFLGDPAVSQAITREYDLIYQKSADEKIAVGKILLKGSLAETYHRLRQRAVIILFTNGAGLMLVALSVLTILEITVARHLGKMTNYADQLHIDELDQKLSLDRRSGKFFRPDELDNLVNTINDLRIRLKEGIAVRRQAQEALRESEARHQAIARLTSDYAYANRVEPGGELVNEWGTGALKRITGFTIEEVRLRGGWEALIHPDDRSIPMKQLMALQKGKSDVVEYRILTKADETRWIRDYARPVCDDQSGNLKHIYGAVQDITERRRVVEALRQSEANYRSIFNAVNDAIAIHDGETIEFLDVNEKLCQLFGYTRDELCKLTVADLSSGQPPFTREKALEHIKKAAEGDPQIFDWLAKDNSGRLFWIEVNLKQATIEGRGRLLAVIRDITDRKQAEDSLRRSEAKFRDLVENINDVIYATDKNGKVIYISPTVENVMGYDPSEIVGNEFSKYVHPDDLAYVIERFSRLLAGEIKPSEYRVLAKSGEYHWIRSSSKPTYEGDKLIGLTGLFTDITERKRLESELIQSRKIETVGTLAGGIAHDFNNILSAIIGFTELALDQAKKNSVLYDYLKDVLNAGERARNLVKQILLYSRQSEFERKPVLVALIAKESVKFLRASLPTTIQIKEYIRSNSLVMADPTQIHQVLLNLCTNAEHAMQDKGGVLQVKLLDVELDEDFTADHPELNPGTHLEVTVSDTGQGMPPHILERIFDPYFTTKEKGRGTGMGLAVVHGIVGNFGGKIFVTSDPGQGSTFKIYFPVVESRFQPPADSEEALPAGIERILFIDDEPSIVSIGKRSLEALGYEVTTMTSSLEALELFKTKSEYFDLVITDMTMPHMTGDLLAAQLMKIRPDIPVIICTGYSQKFNEKSAAKLGIKAFADKPISRQDLAKTVRRVLDMKKDGSA